MNRRMPTAMVRKAIAAVASVIAVDAVMNLKSSDLLRSCDHNRFLSSFFEVPIFKTSQFFVQDAHCARKTG